MQKLFAATTNPGKLRDFAAAASAEGIQVLALPGIETIPEPVEDLEDGHFLVTASGSMQRIRIQAERLANIDAPVLILGENWSGKEAVARLIHKLSSRSSERFLKVNCAALSGDMLESFFISSRSSSPCESPARCLGAA